MASAPHLIFSLRDSLYAVPARSVCEIIWLPELAQLAQSPSYMAGVINLRGKIVPIIDLNLRLGHARQPFQTSDSVIILEDADSLVGVIVSEVRRVQNIGEETIEALPPALFGERDGESLARFLAGIAKVENEIVQLLHLENLLRLPEYSGPPQLSETEHFSAPQDRAFCPQATAAEKAIFRARAQGLQAPLESADYTGLMPLAVVGLNGEYFGIDLKFVREFSALRTVTPVPCCPQHIVGQMNLRGDILTLLDIRSALQMPLPSTPEPSASQMKENGKVVVIQTEEIKVGVMVDEVFDVMNLQPSELRAVPSAAQSLSEEYLQGTAPYQEKILSVLDLPKILAHGALTVNEEV